MKKTIACLAVIASATASSVALSAEKHDKKNEREPANSGTDGYTFAACKPAYAIYQGADAYKNDCAVPLMSITVPTGGFSPPGSTRQVLGCDDKHVLVVTSRPMRFVCLPPGAVEL